MYYLRSITYFLTFNYATSTDMMQALSSVQSADISPKNLVVRFSESVDGFPLPLGHSANPDLQGTVKPEAEAFLSAKPENK